MGRGSRKIKISQSLDLRKDCQANQNQLLKERAYLLDFKKQMEEELSEQLSFPDLTNEEEIEIKETNRYLYNQLATTEFFYHVAPTKERTRIQTHGLYPSRPADNDRWTKGALNHQPVGVYLVAAEEDIAIVKSILKGTSNDVWRVPAKQIKHLQVDWEMSLMTTRPIAAAVANNTLTAELIEKHEEMISDEGWKVKTAQPFLSIKDRRSLKKELQWGEEYLSKDNSINES